MTITQKNLPLKRGDNLKIQKVSKQWENSKGWGHISKPANPHWDSLTSSYTNTNTLLAQTHQQ
jgi:hypothetical protein